MANVIVSCSNCAQDVDVLGRTVEETTGHPFPHKVPIVVKIQKMNLPTDVTTTCGNCQQVDTWDLDQAQSLDIVYTRRV